MRVSYKLSDAIHILAYIEIFKQHDLSSKAIAASIGSNASVVRNLMLDLRAANLLTTHQGIAAPELAKSPNDISIYAVYCAINMTHKLLHIDPKTNPNCLVGGHIQDTLNQFYDDIETAAYDQMKTISLAHVIQDILK
ncbi:MAG: Rrf2 family transcriptional regulator [Leuconostoc gelidum]|jgi:DNA-binding IscR family transcriptional regulator|uniref:Rrf2 family transcriptional regulator n=1 Tax=Leuconostoc gelidum subsp. gelidum TaxID=1607839 RepID=A0AB35FVV4_LEUGE|nr:Rrf2 family transcriptional regulator [Leuconostoc gelidum]AFS41184.1 transcriptional regulator [Leuconostoc gelidum JB7]MBZ5964017.1 Rrf2 family transcriptional regulator [Leuconostoc gelidum subsp. gelidum]MBZ5974242.1 Rrf2 family transcriptional regulator [Leuconostoc gelidum subsp. gelidum]MBZ5976049.1 Rrf2 family transcriptional regulator [Leuconostoc gelidum subsp. gelidum]MBZ5978748.1 Rrf2 family transcriptional regulator [Leuconostoc gelidum subsp. gelidum]